AVRFRHVRGHLCDGLVRGNTDGARKAFPLPHGRLDAGGVACGFIEPLHLTRHIEERLIDADVLEDVRVGSEDLDHALRGGRIPIVVRSQEDGLRGFVPRRANRHATSDPELPRFVTGRHHNAASATLFRICADDHRLADELRILPPLHAHVERVHVHMEDHAGHGPRTAWCLISLVLFSRARRWYSLTGRKTRCPRGPAGRPNIHPVPRRTMAARPRPSVWSPRVPGVGRLPCSPELFGTRGEPQARHSRSGPDEGGSSPTSACPFVESKSSARGHLDRQSRSQNSIPPRAHSTPSAPLARSRIRAAGLAPCSAAPPTRTWRGDPGRHSRIRFEFSWPLEHRSLRNPDYVFTLALGDRRT